MLQNKVTDLLEAPMTFVHRRFLVRIPTTNWGSFRCCFGSLSDIQQVFGCTACLRNPFFLRPRRDVIPVLIAINSTTIECPLNLIPSCLHAVCVVDIVSEFDAIDQFLMKSFLDCLSEEVAQSSSCDLQQHDGHNDSEIRDKETLALKPRTTTTTEPNQDHESSCSDT